MGGQGEGVNFFLVVDPKVLPVTPSPPLVNKVSRQLGLRNEPTPNHSPR